MHRIYGKKSFSLNLKFLMNLSVGVHVNEHAIIDYSKNNNDICDKVLVLIVVRLIGDNCKVCGQRTVTECSDKYYRTIVFTWHFDKMSKQSMWKSNAQKDQTINIH